MDSMRERFEKWTLKTREQTQPFNLIERYREGYLDLYTQKHWEAWQAALLGSAPAPAVGPPCGHRFLMQGSQKLGIPDAYSHDACELPQGHSGPHSCKDLKWSQPSAPGSPTQLASLSKGLHNMSTPPAVTSGADAMVDKDEREARNDARDRGQPAPPEARAAQAPYMHNGVDLRAMLSVAERIVNGLQAALNVPQQSGALARETPAGEGN